jgi:hypothetical protein
MRCTRRLGELAFRAGERLCLPQPCLSNRDVGPAALWHCVLPLFTWKGISWCVALDLVHVQWSHCTNINNDAVYKHANQNNLEGERLLCEMSFSIVQLICVLYIVYSVYIWTCVAACANLTWANNKTCKRNNQKPEEACWIIFVDTYSYCVLFLEQPPGARQCSPYPTPPQTLGSCTCNSSETGDSRRDIICIILLVRMQTSWKWVNRSTQTLQKDYQF